MSNKSFYFKNLDTIRFIAAMMVFMQHAVSPAFKLLDIDGTIIQRVLKVISSGGVGVSIFFVLSGFLITYLIFAEVEKTGKFNIKHFYVRRFLRIWPLYYAVVFFSFIVYPGLKEIFNINNPLGSNFLYHISFLSNFDVINIKENCDGLNALSQNITWSVSIEEQFYLFWPLIFLLPKKKWVYPVVGLVIFSLMFRYANIANVNVLYFHTFSVLIDLVIGGLIAIMVKTTPIFRKSLENTSTVFHVCIFALTFSVLYFETTFIFGELDVVFVRLVRSILFALIIASQALTVKKSFLCLGNFNFTSKWGKLTYGIYLLHPIVITLIDILFRAIKVDYTKSFITHFGVSLLMLMGTFLISWLSYNYFEKRFLAIKSKFQKI